MKIFAQKLLVGRTFLANQTVTVEDGQITAIGGGGPADFSVWALTPGLVDLHCHGGQGFDPELKAILDEQKKPVTFWVDGLGTFALNRALGWFEAEADWLGSPIRLDLDRDEDREKCLFYLRALMKGQADWDGRLRACAARDLLELANDWASDGGCEEHEPEEITREQFMERLEPDAVQISGDGSFDFWFNDGALFWGHSIHVLSLIHI